MLIKKESTLFESYDKELDTRLPPPQVEEEKWRGKRHAATPETATTTGLLVIGTASSLQALKQTQHHNLFPENINHGLFLTVIGLVLLTTIHKTPDWTARLVTLGLIIPMSFFLWHNNFELDEQPKNKYDLQRERLERLR